MGHFKPEGQHFCDSRQVHNALTALIMKHGVFGGDALYATIRSSKQEIMLSTYIASLQLSGDVSEQTHRQLLRSGQASIDVQSLRPEYKSVAVLQPHLIRDNTIAEGIYGRLRDTTPHGAFTVVGDVDGYEGFTHLERPLQVPIVARLMSETEQYANIDSAT